MRKFSFFSKRRERLIVIFDFDEFSRGCFEVFYFSFFLLVRIPRPNERGRKKERKKERHVFFFQSIISTLFGKNLGRITHVSGDDDQRGGDGEQGDGEAELGGDGGWFEGRGGVILPVEPRA